MMSAAPRLTPAPSAAEALALLLGLEGYVEGPPPTLSTRDVNADRSIVRGGECPSCGRPGLAFLPVHKAGTASYRVFAVCRVCNCATEF